MEPVPNWRMVLKHAWSIRLAVAAALLSAIDVGLQMVDPVAVGHPVLIPALATGFGFAAAVARLIPQKKLGGDA